MNLSTAKLTMPQMVGAVPRERLFQLLDELREHTSILWIAAPGGAGKSVLAGSYVQSRKLSCLWLQLDEGDIDPSNFFHYLGQAVAIKMAHKDASLPLFTTEYHTNGTRFARHFFEVLGALLEPSTIIVFDNGEALPDDAELWPLLSEGMRTLPSGITVLFTSRHRTPPAFSTLCINGQLIILDGDALKVTPEEAITIAAKLGEAPALAYQLNEQSGGWMAGLVVMLKQRHFGGPLSVPDSDSMQVLFDFFSHDIFKKMPESQRELLRRTALLPSISTTAAKQLSGDPQAEHLLEQLYRNNLFTERHIGPPVVYQHHPLFRDFLLQECQRYYTTAQLHELKLSSATALIEMGDTENAIRLLAASDAFDDALRLLLQTAPGLMAQGRNQTFLSLSALLPDGFWQQVPLCHYWYGMAIQPFNPVTAREHFSHAFELFRKTGEFDGMLRCWSAVVESMFFAWDKFQHIDPWISWLDDFDGGILPVNDPALELQISATMTAALTMRGAAPEKMRCWAERTLHAMEAVNELPRRISAILYCTNYVTWVRPLDLDTSLMETSLRDAQQATLPPLLHLTTIYTKAALILHRAPDMERLLEEVYAALALANETGIHVWDEILCGLGVFCAVVRHDPDAALPLVKQMSRCVSHERKQGLAFYYYIRAWSELTFGNCNDAKITIAKALHLYAETGYEFPSNVAYYGAAIIYAQIAELDTALAYAQQADEIAEKYQALAMRHTTLLTLAYIQHLRGEQILALKTLTKALRIGREGGYYLTLWWWHAPMMATLSQLALCEGIECSHVIELVRRLKLSPIDPLTAPETWPWPIRITTLGCFGITLDGQPLLTGRKPSHKPLAVLKLLAAAEPKGLAITRVADQLWSELDGDKAQHALEMALHRARKILGDDRSILVQSGQLKLNPFLCRVDTHVFGAMIDDGLFALQQGNTEQARITMEQAMTLYRGHFLEGDRFTEQEFSARGRLWLRYLDAHHALCRIYEESGHPEKVLTLYRRACELDELSEELCRGYMHCCLQLGRDDEARRAYNRLEQVMQQTLAITPSLATRSILETHDR